MTIIEIVIATGLMLVVAVFLAELLTRSNTETNALKMKQQIFEQLQQQKYENKTVAPPTPGP
jgi:type II secretory pathway pseudopilin PulG